MPMSGDVRSNSLIYEEMSSQADQPNTSNVDDYNAYDYATGHVWKSVVNTTRDFAAMATRDFVTMTTRGRNVR